MNNIQDKEEIYNTNSNIDMQIRKDKIASASLICGILAIPGTLTVWFGIIFGISAITLSIISRLNNGKFRGNAAAGLTLGLVFVVISFMLFASMLQMLNDPEIVKSMNELINKLSQVN